MSPIHRWPALILTLCFCFLLLTGWSIYHAATGVSPVDPRYGQDQDHSEGHKKGRSPLDAAKG
jgi:hypothetical protein